MHKMIWKKNEVLIVILLLSVLILASCSSKEPIKIGFAGNLTELAADLGVDARNGAILRVEQQNAKGGIRGRSVELVIKDDKGQIEIAQDLHNEFKEENINLVVGHLMSSMAQAMIESQSEELLFLTPSMSTNELAELNDYIIRSTPTLYGQAVTAINDFEERGVDSIFIVSDKRNAAYSEQLSTYTSELAKEKGIKVAGMLNISEVAYDYEEIASDILSSEPDAVFLITSAIDTAFIAQRIDQIKAYDPSIYSVSWSMTRDMIENGGKSVEGMRLIGTYIPETLPAQYLEFKSAFENRFGYTPTFISELAYDATSLMILGIESSNSEDVNKVREALIDVEFEGLKESFTLDMNGDSDRKYSINEVRNGEFVPDWK